MSKKMLDSNSNIYLHNLIYMYFTFKFGLKKIAEKKIYDLYIKSR